MICPHCGKRLPEDAEFCSECGRKLSAASYEEQGGAYPVDDRQDAYGQPIYDRSGYGYQEEEEEVYEEEPSGVNKGLLAGLIIACVVIVLLLGALVFVIVRNGGDDAKDPTPPTSTESPAPGSSTPASSTTARQPSVSYTVSQSNAPSGTSAYSGAAGSSQLTPGSYRVNTSADDLNIRSGAGTNYSIVGRAPKDAIVQVTASSGEWAMVQYGGVSGWVFSSYLTPVQP